MDSSLSGINFGLLTNPQGQASGWLFDGMNLDEEATPSNVHLALKEGRQSEALDMAIRLRMYDLVEEVIESISTEQSKN